MKNERLYVVKRGKHYNGQLETVHVAFSQEKAEEWIHSHIKKGDHMYIATSHAVDLDELNLQDIPEIRK